MGKSVIGACNESILVCGVNVRSITPADLVAVYRYFCDTFRVEFNPDVDGSYMMGKGFRALRESPDGLEYSPRKCISFYGQRIDVGVVEFWGTNTTSEVGDMWDLCNRKFSALVMRHFTDKGVKMNLEVVV